MIHVYIQALLSPDNCVVSLAGVCYNYAVESYERLNNISCHPPLAAKYD